MIDNNISEYDVVAIRIPRIIQNVVSIISGSSHTKEVPLTKIHESIYINEAYFVGYELPLNRETNTHVKPSKTR